VVGATEATVVLQVGAQAAQRKKDVVGPDAKEKSFKAVARIDTPDEMSYYRHGGILPYVLRQLVGREKA